MCELHFTDNEFTDYTFQLVPSPTFDSHLNFTLLTKKLMFLIFFPPSLPFSPSRRNFGETVRSSRTQLDYFWQRLSWVWQEHQWSNFFDFHSLSLTPFSPQLKSKLIMCIISFDIFSLWSSFMWWYSFDSRTTELEKGTHWLDEKTLGSRAHFQPEVSPASLIINEAQDSDSGIYRCRVDFHKSPTRNSRVQLKIIRKLKPICCS